MRQYLIYSYLCLLLLGSLHAQDKDKNMIALDSMGSIYMNNYNLTEATRYLQLLYEKAKKEKNIDFQILALSKLGALSNSFSLYTEAENYYLEQVDVSKKHFGENSVEHASALNNVSSLYFILSRYDEAESTLRQAIAISKLNNMKDKQLYIKILTGLASLYRKQWKYNESEEVYKELIGLAKKCLDKDVQYAGILNNIGNLYEETRRYKEAEAAYRESTAIIKEKLGEEHPVYARNLDNLGTALFYTQREEEALDIKLKALDISKKNLGMRSSETIRILTNLSILYATIDDLEQAINYSIMSLSGNSGLELSNSITKAWADSLVNAEYTDLKLANMPLNILYDMVLEIGSYPNAQEIQLIIADLAMRLLKKVRDGFHSQGEKLRTLAQSKFWTTQGLKAIDKEKQIDLGFSFAEQTKSVLLIDAIKSEKAYSFGNLPDSLAQYEKQLIDKQDRLRVALKESVSEGKKDSINAYLVETDRSIKAFKAKIAKEYPKYNQLRYAAPFISIEALQKALRPNTAVLEYVIDRQGIFIFYIDARQKYLKEIPISSDSLNRQIKKLHETLTDYEGIKEYPEKIFKDYTTTAYWFYQQLLAPVIGYTQGIKQLIIVPDGELGHIPFETFLTEEIKEELEYIHLPYLLKKFALSYDYSAIAMMEYLKKDNPNQKGEILAFAADYPKEPKAKSSGNDEKLDKQRSLRDILRPIPAARQEVEILQQQFKGLFAFEQEANEAFFKANANNYSVIHLAMHGLLNKEHPPLSSLAFTDVSDNREDNFLQAHEISKLDLNANLVVLSACETGYGRFYAGNGIASLAQAFAFAGVPSLVVSLWQVNDASTSVIMQLFYENLSKGMDKAEALQQAKISYIDKVGNPIAAQPAFWAAFVQIGDSRPIKLKRINSFSWQLWLIVGGTSLLALGAGLWFLMQRKKKEAA